MSLRHAQRAYVLENGRAVLEGEAADLRQRDDIRAFYLGLAPEQATRQELALAERRPKADTRRIARGTDHERSAQDREHRRRACPACRDRASRRRSSRSDAEAIAVARGLAAEFVKGAAERDRDTAPAVAELDAFSQSGLWSINVPKAFGGPEVSYVTLARVI